MDGYRWYEPGDPALYRAIRRGWELGYRTIQPHFPPGVHRHRTLESKNARDQAWADANFEAYQARLERHVAELDVEGVRPGGHRMGTGDRSEARRKGTSRVGSLHGDDGSFDREFWARIPPAERL